jgi:hypothetical protein
LDIIIVNWNTGTALRECLSSIENCQKPNFVLNRVVVIDNGSIDQSAENLSALHLPMQLICNSNNQGFAKACNQGARGSRSDYLLFLNPDTRLFPESLSAPLEFMANENHAQVGIGGVRMVDEQGSTVISCARFPSLRICFGKMTGLTCLFPKLFPRQLISLDECEQHPLVDQVIGAFFLVRRSLFDSLRGFDERFFLYFEEVDFSLRAHQAGYSSYYLGTVPIYHQGAVSSRHIKARRLSYYLHSRVRYAFKHFPRSEAWLLLLCTMTIEFISRMIYSVVSRSMSRITDTIKGYWLFLKTMLSQGIKP